MLEVAHLAIELLAARKLYGLQVSYALDSRWLGGLVVPHQLLRQLLAGPKAHELDGNFFTWNETGQSDHISC